MLKINDVEPSCDVNGCLFQKRKMDLSSADAILTRLESLDPDRFFALPVKEVLASQPKLWKKYEREISKPMDFSTVRSRVQDKSYSKFRAFANDVRLIFTNAMTFNASGSIVHEKAKEILRAFELFLKQGHLGMTTASIPSPNRAENDEQQGEGPWDDSPNRKKRRRMGEEDNDESRDEDDEDLAADGDEDKAASSQDGTSVQEEGDDAEAAAFSDDPNNRTLLGYYLPIPKTNRRLMTVAESIPPLSLYQWEPDPTVDLVTAARVANVPLDQIALPCFGLTISPTADYFSLNRASASLKLLERQRRPTLADDPALFEPKAKKDLVVFFGAYRKLIGDYIEQAVRRGVHTWPGAEFDEEDLQALEGTSLDVDDVLDVFECEIPPAEFFILMHSFATPEQIHRFESTMQFVGGSDEEDSEGPKMWVRIGPTEEMRRMFGPSSVCVPLSGMLPDTFCVFSEPLLFFLDGVTMTMRAGVSIVQGKDLPKGMARSSTKGRPAASASHPS